MIHKSILICAWNERRERKAKVELSNKRGHIHPHSKLVPKNKVLTAIQVIGAAPCPVRKPGSHWAAGVFLCAFPTWGCQRAHLPPVPEDMPGMQTKAATGADSMGIMMDDASLDRWEPLPLSSGEAGWLKKGWEFRVKTVAGWTPGAETKTWCEIGEEHDNDWLIWNRKQLLFF